MENQNSWASGPSSQFAQMSLLNMLAEVATEKLYTDPTVQMISTSKVSEPVQECFNADPVTKSENSEKSLGNEGKPLTLLQVSKMSDVNLLKYFSLNKANEIKKKFYYTCRLLPTTCEQMTQSFGNEEKARNLMKKHLRSHLRALLQINNTHSSQETYVLRSVVKQKFPSSNSELFGKRKGSKNDSKLKTVSSEKENSVSAIIPSFTLKPSKSYGSVKEKETKHALKIIRPNSTSSDLRELNKPKLNMGKILNNDQDSLIRKTVSLLSNGVDILSSVVPVSQNFILDNQEYTKQFSTTTHSVREENFDNLDEVVDSQEISVENSDKCINTSVQFSEYCNTPEACENVTNSSNVQSSQFICQADISSLIHSIEADKSNNSINMTEDTFSTTLLLSKRSEPSNSIQNTKRFKCLPNDDEFDKSLNDYVTVSHDHGYVGGTKATKQKVVRSEPDGRPVYVPNSLDKNSKLPKSKDLSVCLINKENTLLSQHMAIELQGEIMAHDLTYCGPMEEDDTTNGNEGSDTKTISTPLPVVGSEVEFKPEVSDIDIYDENGQLELIDSLENDYSYNKTEEENAFILKKQRKGKGKFIGQSKVEKEMALELINQIKSQSLMVVETLDCNICIPPRTFTAPSTLISHYKSHAGICPYMCRICHAVFTRQHSLNYHMLIHTNQTRFTCDDCGRKFRHPSHFKEHRRRHTGESPFSCMDCSMRFKTRNTYKRHLRTRHGKVLTTQGQVQYICETDGSNSESTIEIKAEDISSVSCVSSFFKEEKDTRELSFENDDSKVFNLNSYNKTDHIGQSCISDSSNNLDYNNLLNHLTPDISIIAVDKSVTIPNSNVSSTCDAVIGDLNNKVAIGNSCCDPVYEISENLSNQESKLLFDISILPAEPLKISSKNSFQKYDNQIHDHVETLQNVEKQNNQMTKNSPHSIIDVDSDNGLCAIWKPVSEVKGTANTSGNKFHSPSFDFNSFYRKDVGCSSELNTVNSDSLVNKIESIVNMELNGMALPLHTHYSSQKLEIRETKYLEGQSTACNKIANVTVSGNKNLINDASAQDTINSTVRAPADKWTNLMKEVLSLSSAVSNKGKQEFSIDSSNSKPILDSINVKNDNADHILYAVQSSCTQQPEVKDSDGREKFIFNKSDKFLIKPTNQSTQTNLTNVGEDIGNKFDSNLLYKKNLNTIEEKPGPTSITYAPVLKNGIIALPPNLYCEVESPHYNVGKTGDHLMADEQCQQLSICQEKSQSNYILKSETPSNHLQLSDGLCFSTTKSEIENTKLVAADLKVSDTSLNEAKVKEMYLIKYIKRPGGHFAKIFKADSNVYFNDSGKNQVNILSSSPSLNSEFQCFKPITESISKVKPVIVTTSKPIKDNSEFSKALLTSKMTMKTNSKPVSLSSNNGTVLVQTKQGCHSDKTSNVMLLGSSLPHSVSRPYNGANNLTVVRKNTVSNVGSYIKIPIMSPPGTNSSIVQSLLIPASTSNAAIISSSLVPLSVTSSSAAVIRNPDAISKAPELSSSPWNSTCMTTGTKTTSLIRTTPSVSSNTITLYPSNAVFINSSGASNIDSEALTLNFSNAESQPSNILILNSGNGGGGPSTLNAKSKMINPNNKVNFTVASSTSLGYAKVKSDFECSKSDIMMPTSSFITPSNANTSGIPLSSTCTLPMSTSVVSQNSMVVQSTSHPHNNAKSNNFFKLREHPPTGILNHLLSSGKSISSGSFYYSNYDGLLKNDGNSLQ